MSHVTRFAAGTCALFLGAFAISADDKKPFSDEQFVVLAYCGGLHEVALGNVAKTNAGSPEVKKFGERMVTDHTKANKDLVEAAKSANAGIPTKMLDDQQKEVDRFSKLQGPEFDKAYMKHMLSDHKQDIALFERAGKEASNPQLKQFATKKINDGLKNK
jgi:putative membrane protein